MVRPGRKRYRTRAQRNGGKTRQEQLREKLRHKNERLREQGLTRVRFVRRPLNLYAEQRDKNASELPMYAVLRSGSKWTLVGFSAQDYCEVPASDHRGGSELKTRGNYYLDPGTSRLDEGMPIMTASTKKHLIEDELLADGSNRVESGVYVVRKKHNPRTQLSDELDQGDFDTFKGRARRVRDR